MRCTYREAVRPGVPFVSFRKVTEQIAIGRARVESARCILEHGHSGEHNISSLNETEERGNTVK